MEEIQQTIALPEPTENPALIAALCKAQAQFKPALKDVSNTFFKSKYADLNAVWEACKDGLAANGLFVSQPIYTMPNGSTWLRTRIYHSEGGYMESTVQVIVTKSNDPQSFGSAVTYFRRYQLGAMLGIVTDDDDAEAAMGREKEKAQPAASNGAAKAPDKNQLDKALQVVANAASVEALGTIWNNHVAYQTNEAFKAAMGKRKEQLLKDKEVAHAS